VSGGAVTVGVSGCAVVEDVSTFFGRRIGTAPGFSVRIVFNPSNSNHYKNTSVFIMKIKHNVQSSKQRSIES